MLKFEIVSSRTVEGVDKEKKYVAYMLQVRQDATESRVFDPDPANVERRYTHFLDLYNGLKKEYPALLNTISFPRKIVVGNFDPNLISTRCAAFESLLNLIANESRLRDAPAAIAFFQDIDIVVGNFDPNLISTRCAAFESLLNLIANESRLRDAPAAIAFFQDIELKEARKLIDDGKFDQALSLLETSFKLLNKVYTDRSRVVLSVLCRIVACAGSSGGALAGPVEKWAQLALRRYEAVSDSDLLLIYIPLLHTCISIWETLGRDKARLVEELNSLRKKGMKVDSVPSLMEAVDSLDATI